MFFARRTRLPASDEINCHDHRLHYGIRTNARRRTLAIQVYPGGQVNVMAPPTVTLSHLRTFVGENFFWIQRQLSQLTALAPPPKFCHGATLPFLGEMLSLRLVSQAKSRPTVVRNDKELWVHAAGKLPRPLVENWYRQQARAYIAERVQYFAPIIGRYPRDIQIRAQRTRWGSCSTRGTVSINWRLVQAPARFLDYVVVHELCHLLHPNHSPQFWNEVARVLPVYRALRREMRGIHSTLVL